MMVMMLMEGEEEMERAPINLNHMEMMMREMMMRMMMRVMMNYQMEMDLTDYESNE